ncbi:phosphoglycerate mutase-like protein [Coniochaeta sp. PMI_546]|nr:phosphoglycerate mutase-like protein [Coniochaeta sp. PMI_546]
MGTPRVFIIRHGETEWSLNGRHTGVTELPLTANGEKRIRATGRAMVGNDRLIVPKKLAHIYVSPRKRAQRTFELLGIRKKDEPLPWNRHGVADDLVSHASCSADVEVTEDIREWDYGDYEGITSAEIREIRKRDGLEGTWDIWRDGCPGGESPEQVTERIDRLIKDIRGKWQAAAFARSEKEASKEPGDILIVAHGHILRAFAQRWVGHTLQEGPTFLLEAGGVGTLSYEHNNINEPAILLGGAFMVDIVEEKEDELEQKDKKINELKS